MTPSKSFLIFILLLTGLLCPGSCSAGNSSSEIVFVGSTPGDELIKSMLKIQPETKVDFIRWNLTLNNTKSAFVLSIVFGESQPNTSGFKGGGEKHSFEENTRFLKAGTKTSMAKFIL